MPTCLIKSGKWQLGFEFSHMAKALLVKPIKQITINMLTVSGKECRSISGARQLLKLQPDLTTPSSLPSTNITKSGSRYRGRDTSPQPAPTGHEGTLVTQLALGHNQFKTDKQLEYDSLTTDRVAVVVHEVSVESTVEVVTNEVETDTSKRQHPTEEQH